MNIMLHKDCHPFNNQKEVRSLIKMTVNINDIKIGIGLGAIRFGCSRTELKQLLGAADEVDTYDSAEDEEEFLTETWHYDEHECSFSFDEEDNWRLTTIAVSSPTCHFNGKQLIGLTQDDVIPLLAAAGFVEKEIIYPSTDDKDEELLICYLEAGLNLWFEHGKLSEIQWGVLWSNEDTPKWPDE